MLSHVTDMIDDFGDFRLPERPRLPWP
jgi:hypothetical protein